MKKVLVVGSLAYDNVMQYDGVFDDIILPKNYNIALSTKNRAMFFGGCSGNIAYSLSLFKEFPVIMTCVGKDFDNYKKWLIQIGVDTSYIYESDKHMTASAFIVTDKKGNQITIFDPGAMHSAKIPYLIKDIGHDEISFAIIAPDNPSSMIKYARECKEFGIPYIFDPAQQISIFNNDDLLCAIRDAYILIVNEYESKLLRKKLNLKLENLASNYIQTHGDKGCNIFTSDGTDFSQDFMRAVKPSKIADPTGCGDAFRAGVIAGLQRGFSLKKACQTGALTASYSLECFGTQCHAFTLKEFSKRFKNNFGESFV